MLAFNRDRWCHLAFCLQLILFHCYGITVIKTYAKLNGPWRSGQLLHLSETSGQLSAERSFDIQKRTWLKIWNIYNIYELEQKKFFSSVSKRGFVWKDQRYYWPLVINFYCIHFEILIAMQASLDRFARKKLFCSHKNALA